MYVPSYFAEERLEVIHDFLRAHPFCSLVTAGADGLFATHLPLLIDPTSGGQGVLRGHVARANPHKAASGSPALAIFHGGNAYVSPAYYPSKRQHGRVVPTWNYMVVHVSGVVRFIDDQAFVARVVDELTTHMEASRASPWKVGDAPNDYLAKMYRAIVGVELEISEIKAKFKLGQNRDAADFQGVIEGLNEASSAGDLEIARAMAQLPR